MEKTKCIIVDDEPLAIELIKDHAAKVSSLEIVGTTHNPLAAIELINQHKVDLLFLDIQMPVLTGFELARTLSQRPDIIFTTAYREYAVESYELNVIDYLVKPITFPRFLQAINKYYERVGQAHTSASAPAPETVVNKDYLIVNANKKFHKIPYTEILYLESLKDYIRIFGEKGNIITKSTMQDFEKSLPSNFLRVHRSFIVNIDKLTAFNAQDVEIGKKEIPIGGIYKKVVQDRLMG